MNEPLRASPDLIRRRLKKIGVMLPLLAISGLLGISLSVPRLARANSGIILETMGTSIAVGTVLGASTLPFYDQPGKHLLNLAYGASAGAVVGLGVLVYQWIKGPGNDDYAEAGNSFPGKRGFETDGSNTRRGPVSRAEGPAIVANDYVAPRSRSPYPIQFWTPVVSLSW